MWIVLTFFLAFCLIPLLSKVLSFSSLRGNERPPEAIENTHFGGGQRFSFFLGPLPPPNTFSAGRAGAKSVTTARGQWGAGRWRGLCPGGGAELLPSFGSSRRSVAEPIGKTVRFTVGTMGLARQRLTERPRAPIRGRMAGKTMGEKLTAPERRLRSNHQRVSHSLRRASGGSKARDSGPRQELPAGPLAGALLAGWRLVRSPSRSLDPHGEA